MAAASWWVVNQISRPGGPRGPQQTSYQVVQSAARPVNAIAGPFPSMAAAVAWQTGANTAGNSPGSAAGGVATAIGSATGLSGITGFLSQLGSANLWIRVGEVAIGLILIAIGVAQLTHVVPIATKIAGAVK